MKKKITLIAHCMSHVFHLAEFLEKKEMLEKIITIYPYFKIKEYKINKNRIYTLYFLSFIFYFLKKFKIIYSKIIFSNIFEYFAKKKITNNTYSNILIGLNGYCLNNLLHAKKIGYKTVVDRACPHIIEQKKILFEEINILPIINKAKIKENFFDEKIVEKMIKEYDVADHILVPSNYSAKSFYTHNLQKKIIMNYIPNEKIFIKKNIDKINSEELVIFAIGFNFIRKGFFYLLKAMQQIKNKNIKLILRSTIPSYLSTSFPSNTTIINSHLKNEDLNNLYNSCDILILPSIDEGFGMVVIEAMLAGMPVITSENVGASDVIRNYLPQYSDHILKIRDINSIKNKILDIYENKKNIKKIGNDFQLAAQKYLSKDVYKNIEELYK
jgi:glycosyltransferase involved in cell wall biosynthesis